jgi:IS5 family transposase
MMARKKLTVRRKGYTTKRGTRVKATTYKRKDVGKPGRTPKKEKWFKPGEPIGWMKDMPTDERREKALESRDGDLLATARALQALANVTVDKSTKAKAAADAKYFFEEYRKEKAEGEVTPKVRRKKNA